MKAIEAPEKIYIPTILAANTVRYKEEGSIEYTRTDAFIEKVARFLEYKLNDRVEIRVAGTLIPSLTSKKAFIEDFKNYMEGE